MEPVKLSHESIIHKKIVQEYYSKRACDYDKQKVRTTETRTATKRKKRSRALVKKAFRPPSPRAPQRRIPSQTRTAIAIARLRNVERRKSSMRRYRGKFKPQPALEKRLYKPEAKPKKFNRA